jgi:hypothetical protein
MRKVMRRGVVYGLAGMLALGDRLTAGARKAEQLAGEIASQYAAARKTLAPVIAGDPQALGPRVLLSQALLQQGRDWPAAEKALLDILDLDPDNKDANHNLKILKRQRSRARAAV